MTSLAEEVILRDEDEEKQFQHPVKRSAFHDSTSAKCPISDFVPEGSCNFYYHFQNKCVNPSLLTQREAGVRLH